MWGTEANQILHQILHLFAERFKQILATNSKVYSTHCEITMKERVLTAGNGKVNLGKDAGRPAPGASPPPFTVGSAGGGRGLHPHRPL